MTGVLIWRENWKTHMHTGGAPCKQTKEMGLKQTLHSWPSERTSPADLRTVASRTMGKWTSVVSTSRYVVLYYSSPRKLMHDMSTKYFSSSEPGSCCRLNDCVVPKFIRRTLIPDMTVFRDGAFGRWLGREVKFSWMELVSLEGETGERGSLSAMWGQQQEDICLHTGKSALIRNWTWTPQPLGLQGTLRDLFQAPLHGLFSPCISSHHPSVYICLWVQMSVVETSQPMVFLLQQSELIYYPRTCPMTVAHCIMAAHQRLLVLQLPPVMGSSLLASR